TGSTGCLNPTCLVLGPSGPNLSSPRGELAGWAPAGGRLSLPRSDSHVQIENGGPRQASIPSVDVLQSRDSAFAVAAGDGRLDLGDPRRQLPLHPRVATRELARIDRAPLLQCAQRRFERPLIERFMAQL